MSDASRKITLRFASRAAVKRLGILAALLVAVLTWAYLSMIRMPGTSFRGPLSPLTDEQMVLRDEMKRDLEHLAITIGPRGVWRPKQLADSADFLERELRAAGYDVEHQSFEVTGVDCSNIIAERIGKDKPDDIIVVGAHYDSCLTDSDCPGANDNGTGVVATLALARRFASINVSRTIRFVLFVNEEPPYFMSDEMGSLIYAKRCREHDENIIAMISLETIGYYSDAPDSQDYPSLIGWAYPSQGNFIAFVGNYGSRKLVRSAIRTFRDVAQFPSEGAALPGFVPGVGWSDHWSFWQAGYDAIMITDTAPFRYPHYHKVTDTPDKVDDDRMSRVVTGIHQVLLSMANE